MVSVATTYFDVLAHRHVLRQELDGQTKWMGLSLLPNIEQALSTGNRSELASLVKILKGGSGALGMAVYDAQGQLLTSAGAQQVLKALPHPNVSQSLRYDREVSQFGHAGKWEWLEAVFPLHAGQRVAGSMVLVTDARPIRHEADAVWRRSFWLIAISMLLITAITAAMVSWFLTRPMSRIADRLRRVRTGHGKANEAPLDAGMDLFRPIEREVETMARSLREAQSAATAEARLRQAGESWWTAEKLGAHMQNCACAGGLFVVSNREPYMHLRTQSGVECVVPPSGLVTALEPVLRACHGVWVAYGSGDADPLNVDQLDHIGVPPEDPRYTLRRVWLSPEEEAKYYDGFANEGLWPLCHIAHTRPTFRPGDWECYQRINERFAWALLAEMKDHPNPVVFIQDYHFALLPQIVKAARPDARVAIFWHIPWPNPEAFGICPWQSELLEGLLGADLIGFHTPLHCHNFLSTVDRVLESRTSHEQLTTQRSGHMTTVRPYPISVAVESALRKSSEAQDPALREAEQMADRQALLSEFGVRAQYLAIGVDRLDYTKGIVERLAALELLLEQRPWYRGRLTMVQIAAPSRTRIASYADLRLRVQEMAERINSRYQLSDWRPVVLIERQCSHGEVNRWYTAADLCMVTSLHDGMNLVSKEFVAARDDEDGVLVLSRFAGAAGELQDALLVNPYDTAAVAEAMHQGLQMSRAERRDRMHRMRQYVLEHNVYLWAADILGDLGKLRLDSGGGPRTVQTKPSPVAPIDILEKKTA